MADPRHEYIAGKVRGFHTRVTALCAFDERARRFASAPVADASPDAFRRVSAQMRLSVVPRERAHRVDRDAIVRPRETSRLTSAIKTPKPPPYPTTGGAIVRHTAGGKERAYSASPREPSRCPRTVLPSNIERVRREFVVVAPASRTRPLLLLR